MLNFTKCKLHTYGVRSKIKTQYIVLPWHLVKLGWPDHKFLPSPTLLSWLGPEAKQLYLSWGPGTGPAYPWVVGFTALTDCRIIKTSQSHPPAGAKGPLSLLHYKACLHSPWFFLCGPRVALCSMRCPSPRWVKVTNKLLSHAQCQVS